MHPECTQVLVLDSWFFISTYYRCCHNWPVYSVAPWKRKRITNGCTKDRGTMTSPKRHRSTNHYTENRRSRNNDVTKKTPIYKSLHRKQKIELHEPHQKRERFRCSGWVIISCSTSGAIRVTQDTNPVISHE